MGTPIGTPPNAIALGALNDAIARGDLVANPVSFGQWMAFGIPYVIVLMVVAWVLLLKIYPIKMKEMSLNIEGAGKFGYEKGKESCGASLSALFCGLSARTVSALFQAMALTITRSP